MNVELARKRARRLYRSKGYQNTYLRGYLAATEGRTRDACPYKLDRKKTWLLAYRRAWLAGFQSYQPKEDL